MKLKGKYIFLVFIAEFIDKNRLISNWIWNSYPQNEMKKFNIDRLFSLLFRYLHTVFSVFFSLSLLSTSCSKLKSLEKWNGVKKISFHIRLLAQLVHFQYNCFAVNMFVIHNVKFTYRIQCLLNRYHWARSWFLYDKEEPKQSIGSTNWTNH